MRAWPRGATLAAVRNVLAGPRGITDDALLQDATLTPDGLLVTFTWRRDPTVYGYLVDDSDETAGPWWGNDVASPYDWAQDLRFKLMEELDTGGVRWAPRLTRDDPVMLDLDDPPGTRHAYYISAVRTAPVHPGVKVIVIGGGPAPVFDPQRAGRWLGDAGLDAATPRSSLLSGRLLTWLQAYTDVARPEAAGHAAASWTVEMTAVLDVLEVTLDVEDPQHLLTRLLWQLVYEATEQGAATLDLSSASAPLLEAAGLGPAPTLLELPPPRDLDPRYG